MKNKDPDRYLPLCEEAFIGGCLQNQNMISQYGYLLPEYFSAQHAIYWQAIQTLKTKRDDILLTQFEIAQTVASMSKSLTGDDAKNWIEQRYLKLDLDKAAFLGEFGVITGANIDAHAQAIFKQAHKIKRAETLIQASQENWDSDRIKQEVDNIDALLNIQNGPPQTDLICLADVTIEKREWLWQNYIELGVLTDVYGNGGIGKSLTLGADIAARITRGWNMPDGSPGIQGNVLVLAMEDDLAKDIKPRFLACGGDPNKFFAIKMVTDNATRQKRMLSLEQDIRKIERYIEEYGIVYVLVDPVTSYLGKADGYKDQDVRRVLAPYAELAQRHKVAILTVRHVSKSNNGNMAHAGSGSIAFGNIARASLMFSPDPDNEQEYLLSIPKANHIDKQNTTLRYHIIKRVLESNIYLDIESIEWLGKSDLSAQDIGSMLASQYKNDKPETNKPVMDILREETGALSLENIIEKLDGVMSKGAVKTALSRLVAKGKITQPCRGMYQIVSTQENDESNKEEKISNYRNECNLVTIVTSNDDDVTFSSLSKEEVVTKVTEVTELQKLQRLHENKEITLTEKNDESYKLTPQEIVDITPSDIPYMSADILPKENTTPHMKPVSTKAYCSKCHTIRAIMPSLDGSHGTCQTCKTNQSLRPIGGIA